MKDGLDDSLYHYSALFYMEGIERRFEYAVTKQTSDHLRAELDEEEAGNLVFEAYHPAERVIVNSRFVQLAHFRWSPKNGAGDRPAGGDGGNGGNGGQGGGQPMEPDPDDPGERGDAIHLFFRGRESPVTLTVDDPEEVFDLVLAMKTEAFARASVVDSAGEEAVLDLRKLVCAEFPLGLSDRGEAQALFEVREEA